MKCDRMFTVSIRYAPRNFRNAFLQNIIILLLLNDLCSFKGASSGIGCACAVEFARWGAKLALTGRNEERLQKTAELCKKEGLPDSKVGTMCKC